MPEAHLLSRFELCSYVRKLSRKPTTTQKLELADKRRKLRARITSFSNSAVQHLGDDANDSIYEIDQIILDEEVSEGEQQEQDNPAITVADPERQLLPFPSAVPDQFMADLPAERRAHLQALQKTELDIREGHSHDCLENVRTAVIHLSWEFKDKVHTALTGTETARAWDKAKLLTRLWKFHRRVYNHNRIVMMKLSDRSAVGKKHPFLELKHCKVSTAIVKPNDYGGSSEWLPWFWSTSAWAVADTAASESEYATECESCSFALTSLNNCPSLSCELATRQSSKQSLGRGTRYYPP